MVITEPELLADDSIMDHGSQVFTPPTSSKQLRDALSYNVLIHIHSVEDFSSSAEQYHPFAPLSDDSGFGGLPDVDSDDSGPRWHYFRTSSGMVDGAPRMAGVRQGASDQGARDRTWMLSWKLPPMSGGDQWSEMGPSPGAGCAGHRTLD